MEPRRAGIRFPQLALHRWVTAVTIVLFSWVLVSPETYFFPRFAGVATDSSSYVAWAMSIAIDGDLDFSNEIADRLNIYPNGHARPVHPAGPGIMAAPVVAILSLGDRLSGHPVIEDRAQLGGSWSYFGYLVASAGALIGGLLLASRSVLSMTRSLTPTFVILVLAGTGIPYYALKQSTIGHSFEFLAAVLVLFGVVRLRRNDRGPLLSMLLIGAGVCFSLLVRPANVNVVLLPLLVHLMLELAHSGLEMQRTRPSTSRRLASGTAVGLVGTFGVNALIYGSPYPSFRQQYGNPAVRAAEVLEVTSSTAIEASLTLGPLAAAREFIVDTTPRAQTALGRLSDLPTIVFTQEYGLLWFMPIVPTGGLLLIVSLAVLWRRR